LSGTLLIAYIPKNLRSSGSEGLNERYCAGMIWSVSTLSPSTYALPVITDSMLLRIQVSERRCPFRRGRAGLFIPSSGGRGTVRLNRGSGRLGAPGLGKGLTQEELNLPVQAAQVVVRPPLDGLQQCGIDAK
jgi:hypothetical protein